VTDKPLALDAAPAREAVEAAAQAGVPLSPYQNRCWDSDLLTVCRLLGFGELGDVTHFESSLERFPDDDGQPPCGGGLLRDRGSHLVDQALLLFGSVRFRLRRGQLARRPLLAALRHEDGVISHLRGGWFEGAPRSVLSGQRQRELLRRRRRRRAGGRAHRLPHPGERRRRVERRTRDGVGRAPAWRDQLPSERGRWDTIYPAFAAAVRGDAAVPVEPRDAVRSLEVLDAVRASAAAGQVVDLPRSKSTRAARPERAWQQRRVRRGRRSVTGQARRPPRRWPVVCPRQRNAHLQPVACA
jgi:predicted dehydrogenase